MAEKGKRAKVQERPKKKLSVKKSAAGTPGVLRSVRTGAFLKAKRILLIEQIIAQKKLAATSEVGTETYAQPLPLEDVTIVLEDPGLQATMQFSERVRTGASSILSPDEAAADREQAAKQIAELQRLAVQKFGSLNP